MKRILFVINNMNIGGIQKSLLELLKVLAEEDDVSVSLFCCKHGGSLQAAVPEKVHILPEDPWAAVSELTLPECKAKGMKYYLFRVFATSWTKIFNKAFPAKLLCRKVKISGNYDWAISFSQPINEKAFCTLPNEIALACCKADRTATFVHCDFKNYGGNSPVNRALYRKFNRVAAVSDSVGKVIGDCIPEVADKLFTVYNCCDREEVKRFAQENPVTYDKTTFVTVARLSQEKGLLRCVPVFARLRDEGYDFRWHIVGGGPLKNALLEQIQQYGMEDRIILEGEQINPHRHVKNADYFLLPSFHEAAPMVYGEANTLGVPILTTETLSARELVENRKIGMVCENHDDGIYKMLQGVLIKPTESFHGEGIDNSLCLTQFLQLCK